MARIRTVKPEFFQHEALQDLEQAHPNLHPMLVFAGLWGHCDKRGVFEWKPRTLKLHILPFLTFEMSDALALLEGAGQIESFENEGRKFGFIPSFQDHQRIGGKEHSDPAKYPAAPSKQRESNGAAPGKHSGLQEGKGSGREGKGKEGKGTEGSDGAADTSPPSGETENVSGQNAPPEDPPSRRGEAAARRNGDFETINDAVSKLLSSGVCTAEQPDLIARLAHISAGQARESLRQLRDRGRLAAA